MIYRLQKKLICICGISVFLVFAVIFALIYSLAAQSLNWTMDALADRISDHDGSFPEWKGDRGKWEIPKDVPRFMTTETPFSTRFFTVLFNENGQVSGADIHSISAVTEEMAQEMGMETYASGRERGWVGDYRYKRYETGQGTVIVYVDGSMIRFLSDRLLLSAGGVLVVSALTIIVIVIFFSKRAVRPVAESYAKQKQFITDANHELKTPLTLVMANLDILEAEIGENEWLSDIRIEGERMSALVNQLVMLTRMDEEQTNLEMQCFSMSDMIMEAVSEFQMLAKERGKTMMAQIEPHVDYMGEEEAVRRVVTILLDNAVNVIREV